MAASSLASLPAPSPPASLPLDIVPLILPHLDRHSLLDLCLLPPWNHTTQRYLHRAPSFPQPPSTPHRPTPTSRESSLVSTHRRVELLHRTLASRPDLAEGVKILDCMGSWSYNMKEEATVDRKEISSVQLRLLSLCPNLVSLDYPGVTIADASQLEDIVGSLGRLETLVMGDGLNNRDPWIVNVDMDIRDAYGSAEGSMESLGRIVSRLGKLQSLRIGAALLDGGDTSSKADAGLSCALTGFTLCLAQHYRVDASYFGRILAGSRRSLRKLVVAEHQILPGELATVLGEFGGGLEQLTVVASEYFKSKISNTLSDSRNDLPHLRSLELATKFVLTAANFDLLAQLPSLTRLRLSCVEYSNYETTGGDTESVMAALMRFPRLKSLSIGSSVPLLISGALEPYNQREKAWMSRILGAKGIRLEFEVESSVVLPSYF